MSTATQTCEIVIPGYTLTERIGSGGYAEVWRAEAPGGIEKAVKIVYGYYDDEFASQELKALERIKGVRHPFLLSLERFEIINGRLAILTELADMSLDQRRQQCCGQGSAGIPREELLRYISDAAEALDFLAQRHSLLHLDIKPENLLVLGDHVKVADFGLVKEIATRTQNSLVSGMTPTYAAPEIFDDSPSTQSDQYSLAIVYQEMLVGTLPFPGRTAAQLAKQHTQAEPQLASVPQPDREVIARALSKRPSDRFESCKAFVKALEGSVASAPILAPIATALQEPTSTVQRPELADDTKPPSFNPTVAVTAEVRQQIASSVTQPVVREEPVSNPTIAEETADLLNDFVDVESADVIVPTVESTVAIDMPTLYIAAGGVGIQTLARLAERLDKNNRGTAYQCVAIDTDRDELRQACNSGSKLELADTLHVPLKLPQDYEEARHNFEWVSKRWLYNIPRSLTTRGYRPLGRIALIDHKRRVVDLIESKFEQLVRSECREVGVDRHIKVAIVCGMGGGTGAGMLIDLGSLVRTLAEQYKVVVEVYAYLVCNCLSGRATSALLAANGFALLTELNHAASHGNVGVATKLADLQQFESNSPVFDYVYCVPSNSQATTAGEQDIQELLACYLEMDHSPNCARVFSACRTSPTQKELDKTPGLTLRTIGLASSLDYRRTMLKAKSADLAQAVIRHWLTERPVVAVDPEPSVQGLEVEEEDATTTSSNATAETAEKPQIAVQPSREMLRRQFGENASICFADEVAEQIQQVRNSSVERGHSQLTTRDIYSIIEAAQRLIGSVQKNLQGYVEEGATGGVVWPAEIINELSQQFVREEVHGFDPSHIERSFSIDQLKTKLETIGLQVLEEKIEDQDSSLGRELIGKDQALQAVLTASRANLLGCGADYRTIVFSSDNEQLAEVKATVHANNERATVTPFDESDTIVVSEATGIQPRAVAAALARMFPGIADAGRRLHTRTDIDWAKL